MHLFLSYVREEKAFCVQIAEALSIHRVWYDSRLLPGTDWWEEIRRRLEWCDGFIYLMSPRSVASERCLDELQMALDMGKLIFPVVIAPDTHSPENISHMHFADLSTGMHITGVSDLLNALYQAEINMYHRRVRGVSPEQSRESEFPYRNGSSRAAPTPAVPVPSEAAGDVNAIVGQIAGAMEFGRYEEAHRLAKEAVEKGIEPVYFSLKTLMEEAAVAMSEQSRRRDTEDEYGGISQLVQRGRTRAYGCQAFAKFREDNPEFDPENLAGICYPDQPSSEISLDPVMPTASLPMLEWCEIPAGGLTVTLERGNHKIRETLKIAPFYISKFPVTNTQFQEFVKDENGYADPRWWEFSDAAMRWRDERSEAANSRFQGDDRPRETVAWYEAAAFCRWLSVRTGQNITLPTRQQWMRAAKGDAERLYPWGNDFATSLCNTAESKLHQTSQVMRFAKGVSPFGVYDLAGNVWEWCLNNHYDDMDITSDRPRAVQGGSHISTHQKAQIGSFMLLAPAAAFSNIGFRLVLNP